MDPKITIGEVIEALNRENFKEDNLSPLVSFCIKRENAIKQELNIIARLINNHLNKPGIEISKLEYWQLQKSKECIKKLTFYTEYLVKELQRDKILEYCQNHNKFPFNLIPYNSDITFLMLNSFHGSVVHDFFWIDDLPIMEMLKITQGKFDGIDFKTKTLSRIEEIKKLLCKRPEINSIVKDIISLDEIFSNFENDRVRSLNLLLITDIEKCVRFLGNELAQIQNLDINIHSKSYNSIDSYLRKIPWKKDIEFSSSKLSILTCNYEPINLRINDNVKLEISLKERLDFLRRRFSLQRNQLFHGLEKDYDYFLNSFVNVTALFEVLKTLVYYKEKYKNLFE